MGNIVDCFLARNRRKTAKELYHLKVPFMFNWNELILFKKTKGEPKNDKRNNKNGTRNE